LISGAATAKAPAAAAYHRVRAEDSAYQADKASARATMTNTAPNSSPSVWSAPSPGEHMKPAPTRAAQRPPVRPARRLPERQAARTNRTTNGMAITRMAWSHSVRAATLKMSMSSGGRSTK
jgi:hypothetical protein